MLKKLGEYIFGSWKDKKSKQADLVRKNTWDGTTEDIFGYVVIEENSFSGRQRAYLEAKDGNKSYNISLKYAKEFFNDYEEDSPTPSHSSVLFE